MFTVLVFINFYTLHRKNVRFLYRCWGLAHSFYLHPSASIRVRCHQVPLNIFHQSHKIKQCHSIITRTGQQWRTQSSLFFHFDEMNKSNKSLNFRFIVFFLPLHFPILWLWFHEPCVILASECENNNSNNTTANKKMTKRIIIVRANNLF